MLYVLLYYVNFNSFLAYILGTGKWKLCDEQGGAYELPPSCGYPFLVEIKLISKPRQAWACILASFF